MFQVIYEKISWIAGMDHRAAPPINIIISIIKEITNPAIAKPRGALKTPIKEKIKPRNPKPGIRKKPKNGIIPNKSPSKARMKPAIPKPLLRDWGC